MGAWGHGILDNDNALDVKDDFEYLVGKGNTLEEVFESLEDTSRTGWSFLDDNVCILVLADLQIEHLGKLTKTIKERFNSALKSELSLIDTWKNPKLRETELIKFQEKVREYL